VINRGKYKTRSEFSEKQVILSNGVVAFGEVIALN